MSDEWFAWFPVRLGALGTGRLVWLRRVWRNRCMGVTIYQDLAWGRALEASIEAFRQQFNGPHEYDKGYQAGKENAGVWGGESVYWLHGYADAMDDDANELHGARFGRPS